MLESSLFKIVTHNIFNYEKKNSVDCEIVNLIKIRFIY